MKKFQVLTAAEQVSEHLRDALLQGKWVGLMPGEDRLMARLSVGRSTIKAALRQLEQEGFLLNQGIGKRRRITLPKGQAAPALRVGILLYEDEDRHLTTESLLSQRLSEAGHNPFFAAKSLQALGMNPARVARFVQETEANAWIVSSASREVLAWFADQAIPTLAMFGRYTGLPIASAAVGKAPVMQETIQRLVDLGHRRIVLLSREERVLPRPAFLEQEFLNTLEANGIPASHYHLPAWKPTHKDFHRCLESLFKITPPTALVVEESHFFIAAQNWLARRHILPPHQVSLICNDPDLSFKWCEPKVTHVCWDERKLVNRMARWANLVARGKKDHKQTIIRAELVDGGTIGPAPTP